MTGWRACLIAAAAVAAHPTPAAARSQQVETAGFLALQKLDQQVNRVGYRLASSAGDLCPDKAPLTGMTIQTLGQFDEDQRAGARAAFGLGETPAILAVAPDSPAEAAGIRPDDWLIAVDGTPVPTAEAYVNDDGGYARVAKTYAMLDRAAAEGPMRLTLARDGARYTAIVTPQSGCPSRFQTRVSDDFDAQADGIYVQITTRFVQFTGSDGQLAAVLGHELAHNIRHDQERLSEAADARGRGERVSSQVALTHQTEIEADVLGIYLMARAGYPLGDAITYRVRFREVKPGIASSPTHPSEAHRIRLAKETVARIRADRGSANPPRPNFMPDDTLPKLR